MKSVRDKIDNKVSKQILFKIYHQEHYSSWKRLHLMYSLETHQQIRDNLRNQLRSQISKTYIYGTIKSPTT